MKDKILAITMSVMMLFTAIPVIAGEFPNTANPGNVPPKIYLIKKIFDICNPNDEDIKCDNKNPCTPGEYFGTGGSTPYGDQTIQYGGCKDTEKDLRYNEYAFTGEQIIELVVVRDLNGAVDIEGADVTVNGYTEAKCDDVTTVFLGLDGKYDPNPGTDKKFWFGHDVSSLLKTIPPSSGPSDPVGVNGVFDKIYECILTVEPSWYGQKIVNIEARDQSGSVSTDAIAQSWFMNPAVTLDLDTNDGANSIWYEYGVPGQTVYSGNKLVITNLAEGGVDLLIFIAADDLTDPTHFAAKCPVSNVLDVEENMEYNCKIGTMKDEDWNGIENKDTKEGCHCVVSLDPTEHLDGHCYGATPLLEEYLPILMNQHEAECQFRLTYPIPCVGSFTEGLIHIIVRAI